MRPFVTGTAGLHVSGLRQVISPGAFLVYRDRESMRLPFLQPRTMCGAGGCASPAPVDANLSTIFPCRILDMERQHHALPDGIGRAREE